MNRPPGRAPHSLGGSLAYLVAIRLVLNTAHRFAYPFLPAISRGLGVSLEQGGLLLSARSLAGLATPLVVATLGRGERRRRMMAAGLALFVIGAMVTAATGVYAGAMAGFALFGLAKPLFDISGQAYIADRTPYRGRARYIALFETTWALALLAGAPAAGWLISRFDWQAPFWAVAALCLLALGAVFWTVDRDAPRQPGATTSRLTLDRSSVLLLAAIFLLMFAAEFSFVVFGAWMEDRFGLSLVALGGAATAVAGAARCGE
jgi:predicted MFS family arabinose efflux permease